MLVGLALAPIASCSSADDSTSASTTPPVVTTVAPPTAPPTVAPPTTIPAPVTTAATFTATGGIEQLLVTDAVAAAEYTLSGSDGAVVATQVADDEGAVLFRQLAAGDYTVSRVQGDTTEASESIAVLDRTSPPPGQDFYDAQTLDAGFGYITTRDGTTLSANVSLPGPIENGPYPTVVEYSGYSPSNPADSTFAQIYTTLGFAYVGVNMRGTGCSGGSFAFFELMQSLDGYDVIETVAAQPWVAGNTVGMVGISYPGISQLFVAATQPPHLSAITPLSVLDDSYRATLYPGGILNTGFAVSWSNERQEQAKPYGQEWSRTQVDAGDKECEANQRLRGQNPDTLQLIRDNPSYDPAIGDSIAPWTFVDRIEVPVFLAGSWQDEQTGGRFPTMLDKFTGTDHLYATMLNGTHTESLSLGIFGRYVEFLDLYVAKRVPDLGAARIIAPILAQSVTGVGGLAIPDTDRFAGMTYDDALRAFEADPPVRILFEEGAADGAPPGAPLPRFEAGFAAWPVPDATERPLYLAADGSMSDAAPADDGQVSYTATPDATPPTYYEGGSGGVWQADVVYNWADNPAGTAATWRSAPLDDDLVHVGSASVDLWIQADQPDVDLEVTVTEIRPDGTEVMVQSGWLRASHRTLDESLSTATRPVQRHLTADVADLPADEWTPVRVEVFPFAHVFRAGSRIRLVVDAPGGNRAIWAFETLPGGAKVDIATGTSRPSRLVLNAVSGVDVPAGAPACGSLRGQPCRQATT